MLQGITWTQFLLALLLIAVVYYSVLLLVYYRKDTVKLFSRTNVKSTQAAGPANWSNNNKSSDEVTEDLHGSFTGADETTIHKVEVLVGRIRTVLTFQEDHENAREEAVANLSEILSEYPELKGTVFQSSVNDVIQEEADKTGISPFTGLELQMLWKGSA